MEVWSFISSFSSSLQKLLKLLVKQASVKQTHEEMQSLLTSQRSPGFSSKPHRVKYQRYQTNPDLNPWGRKDLPQMTREWSPGTFSAWFSARLSNETDRQPVLRSMIEKFPLNYHASLDIMTISWYSSLQFLLLMTVMMILNCILRYFSHSVSPSDFFAFETPLTVFVSVIHPLLLLLILYSSPFSSQEKVFPPNDLPKPVQSSSSRLWCTLCFWFKHRLFLVSFKSKLSLTSVFSLSLSFVSHDIFSRITMTKLQERKSEWSKKWKKK